ncbi:MAG: AAA family ATPase [Rhizobiales bacterium]|nr:AAA family ATPase [Hyphomicrobiales bacterium]
MKCSSCGAEVSEGSNFCNQCGAALPPRCPSCGHANAPGAKFCSECGSNLIVATIPGLLRPAPAAVPTPATVEPSAERRQLTLMFCDLVGSTALAARLDPEDLRDIIAAYQRRVAETVAQFDGFVAKYMGDGVLVYFGYPRAQEDDPELAVRAGLALVDAVRQLPATERVQVRVGIATGLVVVGDLIGSGEAQERGVVGETPNLAARLQALAEPNAVMIAHSTRRLLGGLFEYEDLGSTEVKGFPEPVRAWRVIAVSPLGSRYEALRSGGVETPLVGREEEIELLLRRWRRAKDGEGQVVLISGEPGIGKSRLTAAVQEQLQAEPHARLRYFCTPHHQDSALHPIIAQLERAADFERKDKAGTRLDKLDALLAPTMPPGEDVALLADLLTIPTDGRYPALSLIPQRKKERTFEALLRQLSMLAREHPVLMIFEDVHWIDPTSRELLDLVVERTPQSSVLLVITCRPEFQPPWTGQADVTTLTLRRLNRREGAALVQRVAGGKELPGGVLAEIIERTDGVPLFVEELTKTVLDSGLLRERDGCYVLEGPLPPLAIPATLQASLMARLDRLAALKIVAQTAAVIGREFLHDLLAVVNDLPAADLQGALDRLVEGGLVFRRGTPPDAVYFFKHALVRDAVYESCLKSQRKQLHARIAQALVDQSTFAGAGERTSPEIIAQHYLAAEDLAKALPHVLAAARAFTARYAYVEALRWFEKGAEVLRQLPTDDEQRQRLELDLYLDWTPVLMAYPGFTSPQTLAIAEHADALCQRLGETDRLMPVLFAQLSYYGAGGGSLDRALEIATRIQRHGVTTGDPVALLVGYRTQGFCFLWMGRLKEAEAALRSALEQAPRAPPGLAARFGHDPETTALALLGSVEQRLGRVHRGGETLQAALVKAEGLGHPLTYAYVVRHASVSAAALKDYALVERLAGQLTEVCSKYAIRQWERLGPLMQAWAVLRSGAGTCEPSALEALLDEHRDRGFRRNLPFYLTLVADVLLDHDSPAKVKAMIDEAAALAREMSETWAEPELFDLTARLHAAYGGDAQGAERERLLMLSHKAAQRQGAKLVELRAAINLARLWHDQGKRSEARDLLASVHGWFNDGFVTPDLDEARALFPNLSE